MTIFSDFAMREREDCVRDVDVRRFVRETMKFSVVIIGIYFTLGCVNVLLTEIFCPE